MIAHNPKYRSYLESLCVPSEKYTFDTSNEVFTSIYHDTILRLHQKGYLYEDDPELASCSGAEIPLTETSIDITVSDQMILPISQAMTGVGQMNNMVVMQKDEEGSDVDVNTESVFVEWVDDR